MKVLYKELYTWEIDAEELINFINESKDLGIINNTKDKIMVWGLVQVRLVFTLV